MLSDTIIQILRVKISEMSIIKNYEVKIYYKTEYRTLSMVTLLRITINKAHRKYE